MAIIITGATGQLGGLAVQHLLDKKVPANQIVAVVRNVEKAAPLAALGIEIRHGDYNDGPSLEKAFAGASKILFVPSPDAHDETLRMAQHINVIQASKKAGAGHIIYYGFAFGEHSKLPLALTHLSTEEAIRAAGIPYTFLRNSLYREVSSALPQWARRTIRRSGCQCRKRKRQYGDAKRSCFGWSRGSHGERA